MASCFWYLAVLGLIAFAGKWLSSVFERSGEEDSASPATPGAGGEWKYLVRYDALIQYPEVRQMVARAANLAGERLTADDYIGLVGNISDLTGGGGMPLPASLAVGVNKLLGIRTGAERSITVPIPPGAVIVAVVCSLAKNGETIKTVHQAADGCAFEATIPSDLWTWGGHLAVTVRWNGQMTTVEAGVNIPGQVIDYGKSGAVIERIFNDIRTSPVR